MLTLWNYVGNSCNFLQSLNDAVRWFRRNSMTPPRPLSPLHRSYRRFKLSECVIYIQYPAFGQEPSVFLDEAEREFAMNAFHIRK
jgi:hypothetical protein